MKWNSDKELMVAELANEKTNLKNLQVEHQLALQQVLIFLCCTIH